MQGDDDIRSGDDDEDDADDNAIGKKEVTWDGLALAEDEQIDELDEPLMQLDGSII